jgi:hypothetical protein
MTTLYNNIGMLHPRVINPMTFLMKELYEAFRDGRTKTDFRPFETYRLPTRQAMLLARGTTKAGPMQSAHQYGMAVDFVPCNGGVWSWGNEHDYAFLKATAERVAGLHVPYHTWDKCHVEHKMFGEVIRPTFR